jgi:hypothetical protein
LSAPVVVGALPVPSCLLKAKGVKVFWLPGDHWRLAGCDTHT